MRWISALAVVTAGLCCTACYTPLAYTDAGTYVTHGDHTPGENRDGVLTQIAWFLPNRILDAFDMVHAGLTLGYGLGPDIRITRWGQLAANASAGAGLQWDGRDHSPLVYTAQASLAAGPLREGVGMGEVASIRDFGVGLGMGGAKVAVDFAEVADFVLGWFFIDFREDDYGRS